MNYWIKAARLRTIPLSLSGVVLGSFLAFPYVKFNWLVFILAIIVASMLQILSNFANDYGDGIKGTDINRKGEARMIASGFITPQKMFKAIIIVSVVCVLFGLLLLWNAFGKDNFMYLLILLMIGGLAILAAIYYTVGKNAYGYKGWGDFFVFIFFGLVSVIGSSILQSKLLLFELILPAISVGLLSTAVLNLNNMRDYDEDKKVKKNTLVVILGIEKSKYYHFLLITLPFIFMISYLIIKNETNFYNFFFLVLFIPVFIHLKKVKEIKEISLLDSELKKVGIITFLFSLLVGLPFLF